MPRLAGHLSLKLMQDLPRIVIISPLFCYSKKRLFEELADCVANETSYPDSQLIFDELNRREDLGSTLFFEGAALPHVVLPELQENICVLCILDKEIEYSTFNEQTQNISLVWAFFISEHEDLEQYEDNLSFLVDKLSDADFLNSLRLARNDQNKLKFILNKFNSIVTSQDD